MGLVSVGLYEPGTFRTFDEGDLAQVHQGFIPADWGQRQSLVLTSGSVNAVVGTTNVLYRATGFHGSPGLDIEAVLDGVEPRQRPDAGDAVVAEHGTRGEDRIRELAGIITRLADWLYVPVWQGDVRSDEPYAGWTDVRVARLFGLEVKRPGENATTEPKAHAVVVMRNGESRTIPSVPYLLSA